MGTMLQELLTIIGLDGTVPSTIGEFMSYLVSVLFACAILGTILGWVKTLFVSFGRGIR